MRRIILPRTRVRESGRNNKGKYIPKDTYVWELVDVLRQSSRDKKLLKEFLIDLLSPKEYKEIVTRWQIVRRLAKGVSQRQVAENLKVSIATITRGSRMLLNKTGGFNQVLKTYYPKGRAELR